MDASRTTEAVRSLEALLGEVTGRPVAITAARPLAGGASMETWSIDADVDGAPERLVLRRDMGMNMSPDALTRAQEFRLLQRAFERGVRAPRPRWLYEPKAPGDRAFFVMDRCEGESVGRRVVKLPELAAARSTLAREMGRQLATIHAIALTDDLAFLPRPRDGADPYDHALASTRAVTAGLARANPVWEYGLRWLDTHRPPRDAHGAIALLHGDFRVGNLLVAPSGLSAVIDWEFAHVGDVHEDIAWPCARDWRFEQDVLIVGGVGTLDDYLAGYAEAGGGPVNAEALGWWEIMGNLRWSVMCHAQAERHLSGRDRSVELASLGRKSAEIEWEVLHLIERRAKQSRTMESRTMESR